MAADPNPHWIEVVETAGRWRQALHPRARLTTHRSGLCKKIHRLLKRGLFWLQVFKCWLKKCLKHPVDQVNHFYEQGNAAAGEIKKLALLEEWNPGSNSFYSVARGHDWLLDSQFPTCKIHQLFSE